MNNKNATDNNSVQTDKESVLSTIWRVLRSETFQFVIGLLLIIISVYMTLSFTSFFFTGAADQSLVTAARPDELLSTDNKIQNSTGPRGAVLAHYLINDCFGIPAYFIALFLAMSGLRLIKAYHINLWKWFFGCSILMIWSSVLLGFLFDTLFSSSFLYPGGMHGHNLSLWLTSQIGQPGLILLLLAVALIYLVCIRRSTMQVVRRILHPALGKENKKKEKKTDNEQEKEDRKDEDSIPTNPITEPATEPEATVDSLVETAEDFSATIPVTPPEESQTPVADDKPTLTLDIHTPEEEEEDEPLPPPPTTPTEPQTAQADEKKKDDTLATQPLKVTVGGTEEDREGSLFTPYNPRLDLENYHAPTVDLLKKYEDNTPSIDMDELNANKDRIIDVLRSFGVEISSINATVGPTITLYEITPAQGVRIARIRNLGSDIALSLAAKGIRIIAPIPGKGTIGIEVPNSKARIVPMRDIIASKKFQESNFALPIALGKTITNEVFVADLAKMPHVLVAGATGQGKSVGLNAIITSLLYKKHPAELKFVMVDPKMVEFSMYNPIEKHFLAKLPDGNDAIITDPTKVIQTLKSLCVEMDSRYELLKAANVRQIKEYNEKFIHRQLNPENGHKFLPYIVVIIDEFGDLIMTAGKEIETPIARIAQKARAVGIHMIIATQRPAANIITGVIRANFPARIAFKVASLMESRIILDTPGAEQLIGRGDMLISQSNELTRVQCAFVDTPEVERIADYISHQQGYPSAFYLPEYVDEDSDASGANEVDMNRLDPMFEDAARLVVTYQQGSTSLIQRKFSIGYNRAGRIMDQLEKAGVVGPSEGSKARQVLCMNDIDLEMKIANLKQS